MREKIFKTLNKIYGILMSVSFFAGIIPLIPFIFAIAVGGEIGEKIAVFLYKQYYPWVIFVGSVAVVIGLIAMYVGKIQGLSVKSVGDKNKDTKDNTEK